MSARIIFLITLTFLVFKANGLEEDRNKPLHFLANKMLWDQKVQKMRYTGDVEITQGEFLLKADTVYINNSKSKSNKIESFIAKGESKQASFRDLPKLDEDEVKAWADEISYETNLRKISLKGNAKILRGKDDIKAPVLFYYLDTRNIEARSSNIGNSTKEQSKPKDKDKHRIQITISPETLKSSAKKDKEKSKENRDKEKNDKEKTEN